MIKSAREGAQVDGLFYQNDVESQHGVMKRRQAFQKTDVVEVVQMLEKLACDEENEEVLALYGHENCVLAPLYKNWAAPYVAHLVKEQAPGSCEAFSEFCN